jgi:hypothetical protein
VLVLAATAAVILAVPLRAAEDPAGLWVGITEVPEQGPDQVTLTITQVDGAYAGSMFDSLGMVAKTDLRDVRFADGMLTFGFSLNDGAQMTMTLKVAGDKMAGEWRHPEGDVGAIIFERKRT